jgi:hypothetical protein
MQTEGLRAAIHWVMGQSFLSKFVKVSFSSEKSGYVKVSAGGLNIPNGQKPQY